MFKINTKRTFTVTGEIAEGFPVTLTFARQYKEDINPELAKLAESEDEEKQLLAMALFFKDKRKALLKWEGFGDEEGNEIPYEYEDEKVFNDVQLAVFEAVMDSDMSESVLAAFNNTSAKNSKTGA